MTDDNNIDPDKSIQEILQESMPDMPEERRTERPGDDDINMSPEEQREISNFFEQLIQSLYNLGFSPSELSIIFHGFEHRMNASRYDPHQYDRIALSIELRRTIENWRNEQDEDVPIHEIATTIEEIGRHYRSEARKELYQNNESDTDE